MLLDFLVYYFISIKTPRFNADYKFEFPVTVCTRFGRFKGEDNRTVIILLCIYKLLFLWYL